MVLQQENRAEILIIISFIFSIPTVIQFLSEMKVCQKYNKNTSYIFRRHLYQDFTSLKISLTPQTALVFMALQLFYSYRSFKNNVTKMYAINNWKKNEIGMLYQSLAIHNCSVKLCYSSTALVTVKCVRISTDSHGSGYFYLRCALMGFIHLLFSSLSVFQHSPILAFSTFLILKIVGTVPVKTNFIHILTP